MAEQPAPNVYACIAAVSAEIAQTGISKDRKNEQQHYKFRGIDDVWRVTTPGAFSNDGMPVAGVWVEAGEYTSVANLIPVRAVKANAHLIAAAPDLLAVVRALLPLAQRIQKACANGDHLDYDNEFDAADAVEYAREIERAEKAIAKAEGRT
jgi:hypothetical protein